MPNQQQPSSPTPSLLLTKRLTAFLSANLGPQVHTAVLTTLSGKLLAHASPHSQHPAHAMHRRRFRSSTFPSSPSLVPHPMPSAVTIQLVAGVMVIRRLRCGLLFVCIGPSAGAEGAGSDYVTHTPARTVPPAQQHQSNSNEPHLATPLGSPSEVESVVSAGAATTASIATTTSVAATAVVATRRQAEELARWLDDKLGSLGTLEEGLGVETR
ncbi:hypothetical protein GL218_03144 [Daldinia childiae]|uniref:uncharacterized protein n=1 Tax=Daldinia childiae TaxID=326645 RepID=UPI001444C905|nr:uncharacterized protein GL218_03144 [Daldinia childiae]KAF3060891.1 hypothetical protein GL218_03144 [Daldinia childiae]